MKETKLISFFNIKGGIGKTTNTLLTAYELSEVKQDTKILLIDADIQGNLTQFIYNMNNDFNTIIDIVLDETLTADNIIIKSPNKNYRNIDLIPSNINLHLLESHLSIKRNKELFFGKWFAANKKVLNQYDYIFIDLAPSYSILSQNFLVLSDHIIAPVSYGDIASVRGAVMLKQILEDDIDRIGLNRSIDIKNIITKNENGNKHVFKLFDEYINQFEELCFLDTKIQRTTLIEKSILKKLSLKSYSKTYNDKNKYINNFSNLLEELFKLNIL